MTSFQGPTVLQRSLVRRHSIGYLDDQPLEIVRADTGLVVVDTLVICNVAGSTQTWTIWHVPAGEDVDDSQSLFHEQTIASKRSTVIEIPIALAPGERLFAEASAATSLVLTAYERV